MVASVEAPGFLNRIGNQRHNGHTPRSTRAVMVAGFVILVVFVVGQILGSPSTSAHAELASSDPPADALLQTGPERLTLEFTEPVAADAQSPSVRLIDDQGRDQPLEDLGVDRAAETVVSARVPDLPPGTYTVAWSVLSATDGHTLSGSFAFRVGGGRAPGVATVSDGDPRAWSITTRWLTFLGAALLAGGAAYVLLVAPGALESAALAGLIAIGAMVGLIATAIEPFLYSQFPPEDVDDPSLRTAFDALPDDWWYRPAALVPGAVIAAFWWWLTRRRTHVTPVAVLGAGVAGLVALLGLSLTGHGAGRESWRWLAVASDIVHQASIALWVGGLAALVAVGSGADGPSVRRIGGRALLGIGSRGTEEPIDRFSRLALPLMVAGVVTGVLNTGLILPSLESLIDSTYGRVVLAKVVVLLPILILATVHRARLRGHAAGVARALRPTLRLEAGLAVLVVLGGSVLAMLAPPRDGESAPSAPLAATTVLDLAAPVDAEVGDIGPALHLRIDPVAPGANAVEVYLAAPATPPESPARIPFSPGASVALSFTSLDHAVPASVALATADGKGGFRVDGLNLSLDGWWQIEVVVRSPQAAEIRRDFMVLLSDPNIHGPDAVRLPPTDPDAEFVFHRGLTSIEALHSIRYTQRLSDGNGNVVLAEIAITDGSDGQPPARSQSTARIALVTVGDREWLRRSDGRWTERGASPLFPPSVAAETYAGATSITMGPTETVGGEEAQTITFFVPGSPVQSEAWFVWWVGRESGHVLREAMVARAHYMVTDYSDMNATITIVPPAQGTPAATPATRGATPAATPVATPGA